MIRKSNIGAPRVLAMFYFFECICFMQSSEYMKLLYIAFITRKRFLSMKHTLFF